MLLLPPAQQGRGPTPHPLPHGVGLLISVSHMLHLRMEPESQVCTLGNKGGWEVFLESILVRWNLQCGEKSVQTVSTTEGIMDVVRLEPDLADHQANEEESISQ